MEFRVFQFIALLLIACSLFQFSRCHSEDTESEADADFVMMSWSLVFRTLTSHKILNGNISFNHTTESCNLQRKLLGVETVKRSFVDTSCIFPNESGRSFEAGQNYMLLLAMRNNGKSDLVMNAIIGSIYHPDDHEYAGYMLEYIKPSATRTFPYSFMLSNDLKVGKYDMVGILFYVMDDTPHNTTFFNGTIRIVENPVVVLVRTAVIYFALGFSFMVFTLWGCTKLFKQWENKRKARVALEEAAMKWLCEEDNPIVQSSSKNKKKSKSKKK